MRRLRTSKHICCAPELIGIVPFPQCSKGYFKTGLADPGCMNFNPAARLQTRVENSPVRFRYRYLIS
eukprot:s205_g29.t1